MRPTTWALLASAMAGLLIAPSASAQTLDQVCPGAPEGVGALWGSVTEIETEVALSGASVVATWTVEGEEKRYAVQAGQNGFYAMCLPLLTSYAVHASFGTTMGAPIEITTNEIFTRQDLGLSIAGGDDVADDSRLWLCVDGGQSVINLQFSRLLRCDESWQPLEQCPKEELGRITVQPVGAGSGMMREMIEQLIQEARRIGANAVVNVQDGRGGQSFGGALHTTSITGEGVRIEVDPATCR